MPPSRAHKAKHSKYDGQIFWVSVDGLFGESDVGYPLSKARVMPNTPRFAMAT